jgi:hypothetical protein
MVDVDEESFAKIMAVPWLRSNVVPPDPRWGKRICDVEISSLPSFLIAQPMLTDDVLLVIYRWDRYDYLG